MTRFGSRPTSGPVEFEGIASAVIVDRPGPDGRPPSLPVPDLSRIAGAALSGEPRFHSFGAQEFDVVAVLNAQARLVFVSASAERVFGYDTAHVIGLDAFELFDSSSVGPVRALFDDLVARRRLSVSLEMRTARSDGRTIDLDVVAANHLDDPIGGIVVTIRDVTERKDLEQRFRAVDGRQAAIIESLADGVMMVGATGVVARVNEAFEVMFEAPRVRLIGRHIKELMTEAKASGLEVIDVEGETVGGGNHPIMAALRSGRRSVGLVHGLLGRDREPKWIRTNVQAMRASDGRVTGVVASFSDVTEVRRSAVELRRSRQFLQVLLDTLEEGIVACDAEGRITVFNPAARQLYGLDDGDDPLGTVPTDQGLRRPDGSPMAEGDNPLARAMSGEELRDVEIMLEFGSGDHRKVSLNGQALLGEDGWMLGAVVAMHDVTEQKRNEERLAEMALHDPLTGLANRTLLAQRLQEAIDGLAQLAPSAGPGGSGQRGLAVYLLDLDQFKEINDVLGHDVGDDMLVAVARRLSAIVRPTDTVARLGGDEFVVVCDIESGEDEMLQIADRISTALARPYRIDGRTLSVLASVGGVFADNADTDPSRLLSRADDAMYGVKWSRRRERRSMSD
jgi:diguanylate cyclase (GGDEF)-like protein/PAS domain S-box-containing protein